MAEAERYPPDLVTEVEVNLVENGLTNEPITIRVCCQNGCSRPNVPEIALTGRAPGKYNLYLRGGFHGERLGTLVRENVGEAVILQTLAELIGLYAQERLEAEHFGDFVIRAGLLDPFRALVASKVLSS